MMDDIRPTKAQMASPFLAIANLLLA